MLVASVTPPWISVLPHYCNTSGLGKKHLRVGYRLAGSIQDVWDYRPHLRNLAKFLKAPPPDGCPVYGGNVDSQERSTLRCQHLMMVLVLSSLREHLSERVQKKPPGKLRDYLAWLTNWAYSADNESEDTGRIGFLFCRLLEDNSQSKGFPLLNLNERQRGYRCLKNIFNMVMDFFYKH